MADGIVGASAAVGTDPADQKDIETGFRRLMARILKLPPMLILGAPKFGGWLWSCLKRGPFWFGVALMAFGFYVGDYVYDIFADDRRLELKEDDIGIAWSNGIARLGIRPVYPPQEDLRVGDIWAIISGTSDNVPVLGKAVRLETIDLRTEIFNGDRYRPIFPTTKAAEVAQGFRDLDRKEIGPVARRLEPEDKATAEDKARSAERAKSVELISTSITAFPAFSITRLKRSSGSAGLGALLLGGDRKAQAIEQIKVKDVETYGAPPWEALERLYEWCLTIRKELCEDDHIARLFLSHALPPPADVLEVKDGQFTSRIELMLVTRVFMTREIDSRRWIVDSRGARLELDEKPRVSSSAGGTSPTTASNPSSPLPNDAVAGSGSVSTSISDKTEMGLTGVFQRPLVFGFRSVSITLKQRVPRPVGKPLAADPRSSSTTEGKP